MTKEEKQEIEKLKIQVRALRSGLFMVLAGWGRKDIYGGLEDSIRIMLQKLIDEDLGELGGPQHGELFAEVINELMEGLDNY